MELNFKLDEKDFLTMHLFGASKNPIVKNARRKSIIFLIIAYSLLIWYSYSSDRITFYTVLIIFPLIIIAHYFYFDKKRFERIYKKNIRKNFQKKIGIETTVKFDDIEEIITISDVNAETKIKYQSFEVIEEIKDYFFFKLKTGERLIIPKRVINNQEDFADEIRNFQKNYSINCLKELDWKWK